MRFPDRPIVLNKGDAYHMLYNYWTTKHGGEVRVAFVVQGGGAKGAWQGGVLDAILSDLSVVPVAAFGSSAGAINAGLISLKLDDRGSSPFHIGWHRLGRYVRSRWWRLARGVACHMGYDDPDEPGPRRAHQFPSWLMRDAVAEVFEGWTCRTYTYVQACDVTRERPPVYPASDLYQFEARDGETKFTTNRTRNQTSAPRTVDPAVAFGASACLPTIEPFDVEGRKLMDGGIMSNLPLEYVAGSANIGATFVVLVLPQRLNDLEPEVSFVDWNVLAALHKLQTRLSAFSTYVYCLVEPSDRLWSGLATGLLVPSLMNKDERKGRLAGAQLLAAVEGFLNDPRGCTDSIRRYDLRHRKLPRLPNKPRPEAWMSYAHRAWGPCLG